MKGGLILAGLVLAVAAWGRLTASGGGRGGSRLTTHAVAPVAPRRKVWRPGSRKPSPVALPPLVPFTAPGGGPGGVALVMPAAPAKRGLFWRSRLLRALILGVGKRRPRRTALTAAGVLVGGWLAVLLAWRVGGVVAVGGLRWRAAAVLVGVVLAPASPWLAWAALYGVLQWRRHETTDPWVALWRRLAADGVGADGKPTRARIPGSRPVGRAQVTTDEPTGLVSRVVLRVRPGRVEDTLASARRKVDEIAAVYLTHPGCVTVDADRDEWLVTIVPAEWADHVRARDAARVAAVVEWERPTLDVEAGTFELGRVVGDWSPAPLDLWTPGWGARHVWLLGETGSGKTYCLDDILLDASASGLWVPHIIDLEDGPTLDGWRGLVPQYATTIPEALDVWAGVMAEHERRKPLIKTLGEGVDVMTPTPEHPGHLVVVDGGPKAVTHPQFMGFLRTAAFEWRKFMLKVVWISQPGTADQAFGKSDVGGTQLQNQFKTRVGFRAGPEASMAMFGVRDLLPSISEATPGVAWMRSAQFPEPTLVKTKFQSDRRGLRERWARVPAWERPAIPMPTHPIDSVEDTADARREATVTPIIRPTVRADVPLDAAAAIREVLAGGPCTEKDVAARTGLSVSKVNAQLRSLGAAGVAVKVGGYGGRWTLVEVAR